jgi:hypothetical protein
MLLLIRVSQTAYNLRVHAFTRTDFNYSRFDVKAGAPLFYIKNKLMINRSS